ncbi:probable xyloglucan endotransglucosylase/hydrolase protein 30 [Primulina eburnea]|uniref:probable xyloglucan endotransglucosylase/hydrolase protein 30 n=1 Tax=Primulina eburnea TaxID=1245227 RepID=UPI003C6BF9C2
MDEFHCSVSFFLVLHVLCAGFVAAAFNVSTIPFERGFTSLFGESNIIRSADDRSVQLHLNQFTGSGFKSSDLYNHGFFSAKIKLPSDYTAGIVVAFYTTNGDIFRKTHDELDFEFLGNIKGKAWRFQTNMYGNGSTDRGREERYYLWFDPCKEFHRYSILWTTNKIIFYIDDVPIREMVRKEAMGGDFPSKPMGLYATIWDGSDWATSGGKYRANYKYAPFVAEFTDLVLQGCTSDPLEEVIDTGCADQKDSQLDNADFANITPKQRLSMKRFRSKYVYYSYCYDIVRYPVAPPECDVDPAERRRYKDNGRLKFDKFHRRSYKRRGEILKAKRYDQNEDDQG